MDVGGAVADFSLFNPHAGQVNVSGLNIGEYGHQIQWMISKRSINAH